MISKWYHLNEPINARHRNTLVFTTNTLNQISPDSKNKTIVLFSVTLGASCNCQKFDFRSMCTFITKSTLKTRLEIVRGYVYIYNLFTFSPYRYSSSTQLTRHKIHSDTQKSFDPHLRTKPNYSLLKLTINITPKPQQTNPIQHHNSPTLS